MFGKSIEITLYALLAITIFFGVYSLYCAWRSRSTQQVEILVIPLSILALVAATTPYIGLVGTVWHIIQALGGIGSGDLNVAAIAKPIGEALHATLLGLMCAIPALIFHRVTLMLTPEDLSEVDGE